MPFDWNHLVRLARLLQATDGLPDADREAVLRSLVNRAYFGVYGVALDYAVQYLEFQAQEFGDDHGRLRDHYRRKRRANVAHRLHALREWRNQCDYDPAQDPDFEAMERDALAEAQYIVDALPVPH